MARLERDDGGSGVHIVWEVCELVDDSPVPDSRYGHSMTTLPHNGLMVMYGGRNDDQVRNVQHGYMCVALAMHYVYILIE